MPTPETRTEYLAVARRPARETDSPADQAQGFCEFNLVVGSLDDLDAMVAALETVIERGPYVRTYGDHHPLGTSRGDVVTTPEEPHPASPAGLADAAARDAAAVRRMNRWAWQQAREKRLAELAISNAQEDAVHKARLEERARNGRMTKKQRAELRKTDPVLATIADQARNERLNAMTRARTVQKAVYAARLEAYEKRTAEERQQAERRRLEGMMRSAPGASTAHRGVKSTWNAADPTSVRREPDERPERLTDGKRHPVRTTRVETMS